MNRTITIPQRTHKNSDPRLFTGVISFNDFDTAYHNPGQFINKYETAERFNRSCQRGTIKNNYKKKNEVNDEV